MGSGGGDGGSGGRGRARPGVGVWVGGWRGGKCGRRGVLIEYNDLHVSKVYADVARCHLAPPPAPPPPPRATIARPVAVF